MSLTRQILVSILFFSPLAFSLSLAGGGGDPGGGNGLELSIIGYGAEAAIVYDQVISDLTGMSSGWDPNTKQDIAEAFNELKTEILRQHRSSERCFKGTPLVNLPSATDPATGEGEISPPISDFGVRLKNGVSSCRMKVIKERDFCDQGDKEFASIAHANPRWCEMAETRDAIGNSKMILIKEERVSQGSDRSIEKLSLHEYLQNCLGYCDSKSEISLPLYRLVRSVLGLQTVVRAEDCKIGGCKLISADGTPSSKRSHCQLVNPNKSLLLLIVPFRNPEDPGESYEQSYTITTTKNECESIFSAMAKQKGAPFLLVQPRGGINPLVVHPLPRFDVHIKK